MIINSEKSIKGIFAYAPDTTFEKGDFVVKGGEIYNVLATVTGKDPSLPANSLYYKLYLGNNVASIEEYLNFDPNKDEDKEVSLLTLSRILQLYMSGFNSKGLISNKITKDREIILSEFFNGDESEQEDKIVSTTLTPLDTVLETSDLNNAIFRVDRDVVANFFITKNENNSDWVQELGEVILRQFTYIADTDKKYVRVQELVDPTYGTTMYRYVESTSGTVFESTEASEWRTSHSASSSILQELDSVKEFYKKELQRLNAEAELIRNNYRIKRLPIGENTDTQLQKYSFTIGEEEDDIYFKPGESFCPITLGIYEEFDEYFDGDWIYADTKTYHNLTVNLADANLDPTVNEYYTEPVIYCIKKPVKGYPNGCFLKVELSGITKTNNLYAGKVTFTLFYNEFTEYSTNAYSNPAELGLYYFDSLDGIYKPATDQSPVAGVTYYSVTQQVIVPRRNFSDNTYNHFAGKISFIHTLTKELTVKSEIDIDSLVDQSEEYKLFYYNTNFFTIETIEGIKKSEIFLADPDGFGYVPAFDEDYGDELASNDEMEPGVVYYRLISTDNPPKYCGDYVKEILTRDVNNYLPEDTERIYSKDNSGEIIDRSFLYPTGDIDVNKTYDFKSINLDGTEVEIKVLMRDKNGNTDTRTYIVDLGQLDKKFNENDVVVYSENNKGYVGGYEEEVTTTDEGGGGGDDDDSGNKKGVKLTRIDLDKLTDVRRIIYGIRHDEVVNPKVQSSFAKPGSWKNKIFKVITNTGDFDGIEECVSFSTVDKSTYEEPTYVPTDDIIYQLTKTYYRIIRTTPPSPGAVRGTAFEEVPEYIEYSDFIDSPLLHNCYELVDGRYKKSLDIIKRLWKTYYRKRSSYSPVSQNWYEKVSNPLVLNPYKHGLFKKTGFDSALGNYKMERATETTWDDSETYYKVQTDAQTSYITSSKDSLLKSPSEDEWYETKFVKTADTVRADGKDYYALVKCEDGLDRYILVEGATDGSNLYEATTTTAPANDELFERVPGDGVGTYNWIKTTDETAVGGRTYYKRLNTWSLVTYPLANLFEKVVVKTADTIIGNIRDGFKTYAKTKADTTPLYISNTLVSPIEEGYFVKNPTNDVLTPYVRSYDVLFNPNTNYYIGETIPTSLNPEGKICTPVLLVDEYISPKKYGLCHKVGQLYKGIANAIYNYKNAAERRPYRGIEYFSNKYHILDDSKLREHSPSTEGWFEVSGYIQVSSEGVDNPVDDQDNYLISDKYSYYEKEGDNYTLLDLSNYQPGDEYTDGDLGEMYIKQYSLSNDTTVQEDKDYYVCEDGDQFIKIKIVSFERNPSATGTSSTYLSLDENDYGPGKTGYATVKRTYWYVYNSSSHNYERPADTSIDEKKKYYVGKPVNSLYVLSPNDQGLYEKYSDHVLTATNDSRADMLDIYRGTNVNHNNSDNVGTPRFKWYYEIQQIEFTYKNLRDEEYFWEPSDLENWIPTIDIIPKICIGYSIASLFYNRMRWKWCVGLEATNTSGDDDPDDPDEPDEPDEPTGDTTTVVSKRFRYVEGTGWNSRIFFYPKIDKTWTVTPFTHYEPYTFGDLYGIRLDFLKCVPCPTTGNTGEQGVLKIFLSGYTKNPSYGLEGEKVEIEEVNHIYYV